MDAPVVVWEKNPYAEYWSPSVCQTEEELSIKLALLTKSGYKFIVTQEVSVSVSVQVRPSGKIPDALIPQMVVEAMTSGMTPQLAAVDDVPF